MAQKTNMPPKKEKAKIKLSIRLSVPILLVVILQLVTFFVILILTGEFRNIRQYTYSTLEEKTENRRNYIQTALQDKPPFVQEYAEEINRIASDILEENGATVTDLKTEKELSSRIIEASVETMISLMRRSIVNDVYLILETGDLYAEDFDGFGVARAALYLRDMHPRSDSGYDDLLMEIGPTSISHEYGITRDSGWSLYFTPDPNDMESFGFYYKTLKTAQENRPLALGNLGYWSGFSRPSARTAPSMKYSLPLVSEDGIVYGILGVGLTESTILSNIPSNDFLNETACYVLGRSVSANKFDVVTYSGSSFGRLVGDTETLRVSDMLEERIYDFDTPTDIALAGSVKYISLYDRNSPFGGERWALISVAERSSVLRPVTTLSQMLMISAILSLIIAAAVAILSCIGLIKPISGAIRLMNDNRKYSEVIRFQPSNIYEIDKMTDAITQLQINVREFSSQVSKMIRVADVGLGTFMYDRADDSVFVGQSLLKFLRFNTQSEQDVMMTRREFLDSIIADNIRSAIEEGLEMTAGDDHTDYTGVYSIDSEDGTPLWMRLSLVYSTNTTIGILQDVTDTMLEKKRIEYERDYDSFTGLLNRHAYHQRIGDLFRDKSSLRTTAFIMIDLDNLKYVNDTYGHDFGDDYIKTAAATLKKFQHYGGIVSRISGDEFNICLPGFSSKEEVREIIAEVRDQLLQGTCLLADGTHFKIRASIGISWYPDDADTYELLMKYADFAMYSIKHSTKGEIAEFDMTSYKTDALLLTGVEEMNRIIEESAVRYAFQSIVSAKTGDIYGYEALMRVQSQIFQSPLELLRTAKTDAKLYEIERLTWLKSLSDFQTQIDEGRIDKNARIFINSIANTKLEAVDEAVIQTKYSHFTNQIVMEILESESSNEEYTAHKMNIIKVWGGQLALDDFGTGYNSEYALITAQPNIVKIDNSIISGCDKDASRRMIINNLVRLSRAKNFIVVAEGVETEEEMKTVISCGVDLMQGYYISRPLFEPQPLPKEIVESIRRLAEINGYQRNPR